MAIERYPGPRREKQIYRFYRLEHGAEEERNHTYDMGETAEVCVRSNGWTFFSLTCSAYAL
jgi:hypothetical protein